MPQDLQDIINAVRRRNAPDLGRSGRGDLQRGIKHGVRKVNIDTDNRMAMTGQIRKILWEKKAEFDPRSYLKPAMAAMEKVCIDRFERFGTAGNASKIRVVPLSAMADRYAKGEFDPKVR